MDGRAGGLVSVVPLERPGWQLLERGPGTQDAALSAAHSLPSWSPSPACASRGASGWSPSEAVELDGVEPTAPALLPGARSRPSTLQGRATMGFGEHAQRTAGEPSRDVGARSASHPARWHQAGFGQEAGARGGTEAPDGLRGVARASSESVPAAASQWSVRVPERGGLGPRAAATDFGAGGLAVRTRSTDERRTRVGAADAVPL